jgi:ABC-type uncharacterized transport system substrate-binding protein
MTETSRRRGKARRGLIVRRIAARLVLAASAALAMSSLASAHPDIRIDNRVTVPFDGARVTGIEESWTFDAAYSKSLLEDYDSDHDGKISAAESRAIAGRILPNLAEFQYFTYVWVDKQEVAMSPPRDFLATASGGRVTFRFVVDLPAPIDPQRQALKVEIDDRDYYAEIRLVEKDPVALRDSRGIACVPRIREDVENAYFGYVYPQEITLACR